MTTSSSSAAEKKLIKKFLKQLYIYIVILLICCGLFHLNKQENNTYILKTFEFNGSLKDGDSLFKMNCAGCDGITARGLVRPDLNSITQRLNDTGIFKKVTEGLIPLMPSFEIDPQNISNLLTCLHSL